MLTLNDARRIIAAAEKKAAEIRQPMNIAVVDDISTMDLAQHSQSGGQFFGIHVSNHGRVMVFAGGIPLKREGKIVGAIGVSGGSDEQDHTVAEAGATGVLTYFIGVNIYGKESWSCVRRTGKS
jgi:uncharacterized protein GlcG (DUF336 family)